MQSPESKWISEHSEIINKQSGKWIAVLKDKIVAVGDSITEIKNTLKEKGIKELPLITKIPRRDEEMSILKS